MPTSATKHFRRRFSGLVLVVVCLAANISLAQPRYIVCDEGSGKFESRFVTGVAVAVGAARIGGLGKRSCEASLTWNDRESVVTSAAYQVDIDLLGADPGFGEPIVAFQVKQSAADWDVSYLIYSLRKPPKLLRTIRGGDFFRAADTNLDGRIEVWTGDVGATHDLDGLLPGEFDFLPTVVLRFEHHGLICLGARLRPSFQNHSHRRNSRSS